MIILSRIELNLKHIQIFQRRLHIGYKSYKTEIYREHVPTTVIAYSPLENPLITFQVM